MPKEILDHLGGDFGIVGEGEHSFIELINRLAGQKNRPESPRGGIIAPHCDIADSMDHISDPDRSAFDNKTYLKWGGMGNIQTKRGCPFTCIYCTYPIIEGKHVKLRSPERVCNEIETMLNAGTGNLFFVDNEFNYPLDHAEAICEEIIRRKLSIEWSCYANPGFVTPRLIELMKAAGCTGIEFGSDASNDTVLRGLGKNFTVQDLKRASAICRQEGLPLCHSLLLGGPGETMDTVRQTVDSIIEMSPTAIICMIGIRMFPDTRLSLLALEEKVIDRDENFLGPLFYISPAIKGKILPFIEEFARENPTWIFPGLNINMSEDLQKRLRRFGLKGPLWEYMERGKMFRRHSVPA
jgi:radical SAM superfamily enzyme YgiQ (UPF0313 family)